MLSSCVFASSPCARHCASLRICYRSVCATCRSRFVSRHNEFTVWFLLSLFVSCIRLRDSCGSRRVRVELFRCTAESFPKRSRLTGTCAPCVRSQRSSFVLFFMRLVRVCVSSMRRATASNGERSIATRRAPHEP